MSHELPTNNHSENPSLKVLEIELTQSQFKALQRLLPKGYKLELITTKRDTTPKPTKKSLHNDSKGVKKTLNYDNDSQTSPSKRNREVRKKKYNNFDDRYDIYEPAAATSSKSYKTHNDGVRKCF